MMAGGAALLCYRSGPYRKLWLTGWWLSLGTLCFLLLSIRFLRFRMFGLLPFYAGLRFQRSLAVISVLVIVAAGQLTLVYQAVRKKRRTWFFLAMVLFAWVITLLSNGIEGNLKAATIRTFSQYRLTDYYANIVQVNTEFIFHYARVMPRLNLHPATHPPLAVLFLWLLQRLGLGIIGSSLVVSLCGSLTLLPASGIARELFGEREAIITAAVFPLVPVFIIYSAVSLDALFMLLSTLAVWGFVLLLKRKQSVLVSALLFSLALFSTFMDFFLLPLFFLLDLGIKYFPNGPDGLKPLNLKQVAAWAGTVAAFYLGMYLLFNYNLVEVFLTAKSYNDRIFALGARPYLYWVGGNLVDYFVYLGIPLSALLSLDLKEIWQRRSISGKDAPLAAVLFTLLVLTFSGLIKREVARVWMVFTPFLLAALSGYINRVFGEDRRAFVIMLAALFSQALVFESFLDSLW